MEKGIIKEDVPQIKELIQKVLGTDHYTELSRMGGLTNHTYRVVLENNEEYVVRIPGLGTEEMIVRSDERISTELACDLDIDAEMLYFGENGTKVSRFIQDAVTMSADTLKRPGHIQQVAEFLKKLHRCGVDTKIPFEVFDMAEGYEKIIREKQVSMFDDYKEVKEEVMRIKTECGIWEMSQSRQGLMKLVMRCCLTHIWGENRTLWKKSIFLQAKSMITKDKEGDLSNEDSCCGNRICGTGGGRVLRGKRS